MKHWNHHAKQWHLIGEPLRPCAHDIDQISSWIFNGMPVNSAGLNVLLLGVTPELAAISWPDNTCLFVVDASIDMIQLILLPQQLTLLPIICVGNWLYLPFADGSMDVVIGDGCFSMLAQNKYDNMVNEIIRVLKPAGCCCMRFFTRPEVQESIDSIYADFVMGKIDNFHILKWRIAMALQKKLAQGVNLHSIWDIWNSRFKNESKALVWPEDTRNTIEIYKNNPASYTFPSLPELSLYLHKKFKQQNIYQPKYTLGECCPLIQLQSLTLDQ